jgi:hypothetical protein
MLSKLALLLKSKAALAVVGAVLIGGTGAVAVAATEGRLTPPGAANSSRTGTHGAHATQTPGTGNHGHTVAIEGTLIACPTSTATPTSTVTPGTSVAVICVQDARGTMYQVAITSTTTINGDHALTSLSWSALIGFKVQVQATTQPDGSLAAWKVTIEGGSNSGKPGVPGQRTAVAGTIATLGTNSLALTLDAGGTQLITVSSTTVYAGKAHQFSDLAVNMRVTVQGNVQPDQSIAATRIEAH